MSPDRLKRISLLARLGAAVLTLAVLGPAHAQVPASARIVAPIPAAAAPSSPSDAAKPVALPPANAGTALSAPFPCSAPKALAGFDHPLRHTARRLARGEPLTIVAIGSSSTAGAGASSPAANYPSRLAVELKQRFPGQQITVLNRGVNGEETADMMARFETDVIAEHPQLVLWQVGTNSVLRDHPLEDHSALLREGIDQLRDAGADVVLIDPQYAPKVIVKSETPAMVDLIALAAKEDNVGLFHRFAIMRDWYEVRHIPFETLLSPDGLHMNDGSYACVAKLLATAISEASTRPVASAAVHSAR